MGGLVDLSTWKRQQHYELFRNFAQPFFSVTAEVDVSALWERCHGPATPSFFLGSVFCALRAVNSIETFRLRIRGNDVYLHDRVGMTPTVMREDRTFAFTRMDLAASFPDFERMALAAVHEARNTERLRVPPDEDDLVYHSTLPWIRFTAFSNALPLNDCIPRMVFGKASRENGAWRMPVAVEVHHALVDGADVGAFYETFQAELDKGL